MKKANIKYFTALLLFGTNGIVASQIMLSSDVIVFFRTLTGSLFLIACFILSGQKAQCLKNKKHFTYLMISGLAMGAGWIFLYEAYVRIGVSVATLAYYCGPVIVMVMAPLVFRERMTAVKLFGFFSVIVGMVLVNYKTLMVGGFSWGLACGFFSAVMYAVMVIFSKKASSITGLENPMWQLIMSFAAAGLYMLLRKGPIFEIPAQSLLPILLLGIVNTGIGCYLYFSAISQLSAQSVAICGYLEPVSALVFSAVLLNERLTFVQVIGTVFIIGGAAFGECFGQKRMAWKNHRKIPIDGLKV